MLTTTLGQLLVNQELPEDLRDYDRVIDKKGVSALLQQVAQQHPEKYRRISHGLAQIGWRVAQQSGGYSFGLAHLRKSAYARQMVTQMQGQIQQILDNDNLDDKSREDAIVKLVGSQMKTQQSKVFDESMAEKNPLAMQLAGAGRGNKMNLSSLRGSDMLYADHRDNVIPIPVLRSYSEGLRPEEYFAGTYGARKGVIDTKFSTQEAGFFGKQLNQVSHRLVIEDLDGDGEPDGVRGLPVNTDDADNEGALLAADAGPYKRNQVLTPKILRHLSQIGASRILVRSPTVSTAPGGGIFARDVGVREHGVLPGRGENVGLTAAQALSEPMSQGMLSSKHTGGVAGEGKTQSGFDYINQLVQVPKHFKGGAAHAEVDGIVGRVEPAPAGGNFIYVNGEKHYAGPGTTLKVKTGDRVEAGDVLTDGLPNPATVVKHKGIGEGRRYFVESFRDAMRAAGVNAHRRNVELLGRGLINHVRLNGELGDYGPDDMVPYHMVERYYQPREDAQSVGPELANGQYLEKPVLHYTIGTKVRPSMSADFKRFGVKQVTVHREPPPFEPEMVRGMYNLAHDPDWMTRMYGSGLKKSLLDATHRGGVSSETGSSFVPSLARAVDFGRQGLTSQPGPGTAVKLSSDGGVTGDSDLKWDGKAPGVPAASPAPALKPPQPTQPMQPPQSQTPAVQAPHPAPQQSSSSFAPYFGAYQSKNMMSNPLVMGALSMVPNLPGPLRELAPLAMMMGLDFNAFGALTRGPNAPISGLPQSNALSKPQTVAPVQAQLPAPAVTPAPTPAAPVTPSAQPSAPPPAAAPEVIPPELQQLKTQLEAVPMDEPNMKDMQVAAIQAYTGPGKLFSSFGTPNPQLPPAILQRMQQVFENYRGGQMSHFDFHRALGQLASEFHTGATQ